MTAEQIALDEILAAEKMSDATFGAACRKHSALLITMLMMKAGVDPMRHELKKVPGFGYMLWSVPK
jgi:hypothetical protein